MFGPLGNSFVISPGCNKLLLVAGGIGIAPLAKLADEALARDHDVTVLMGALNSVGLLDPSYLPQGAYYILATDDGSSGHKGLVTDLVPRYLCQTDQVFACGPEPMLRALVAVFSAPDLIVPRTQISLGTRTVADPGDNVP